MNLSKETKQQIAINYMNFKSTDLIKELKEINNEKVLKIKECIYKLENISKDDIENFCNNMKSTNDKYLKYINTGNPELRLIYNADIRLDAYNNVVSILYTSNNAYDKIFGYDIESVFISTFNCYSDGRLQEDKDFKDIIEYYFLKEESIKLEIQSHYDNLYELIRNIRTLDRIKKQFADVVKYLPDNIVLNESSNKETIKELFNKI